MAARGLTVVSNIPSSSTSHKSSRKPHEQVLRFGLTSSFKGTKLPVIPSSFNLVASDRRLSIVCNLPTTIEPVAGDKKPKWSATAIKAFSMNACEGLKFNRRSPIVAIANFPTSNTEAVAAEKKPKWSSRALRVYTFADVETRKLKHPTLGSDTLLLGLLLEGTSRTAKYLREHGITHFKAREEVVKLLGKGDKFQPDSPKHSPFTQLSKRCLEQAVEIKLKSGEDGELTCAHMLLGMWEVKESAAHKVLAALGFDDEKAKQVAKTMDDDAKPNFKRSLVEDLAAN